MKQEVGNVELGSIVSKTNMDFVRSRFVVINIENENY